MPYTYLIGWTHHNLYYYGCRYSKSCNPEDLWVSYFTSSKEVTNVRGLIGEPDVIEVRRIFESKSEAIEWEHKVLRRLKVVTRKDFLNKHDAPAPPLNQMFGSCNPQTRPEGRQATSVRMKVRAQQLISQGRNTVGRPLSPPVVRTCPCCGDQKVYKTYKLRDVETIRTRMCKSCAAVERNRRRGADGFYERIKGPRVKTPARSFLPHKL